MKTIIINKVFKFGAFLIKKLKNYFESYDYINKDLYAHGKDYRMIIGPGLFYF